MQRNLMYWLRLLLGMRRVSRTFVCHLQCAKLMPSHKLHSKFRSCKQLPATEGSSSSHEAAMVTNVNDEVQELVGMDAIAQTLSSNPCREMWGDGADSWDSIIMPEAEPQMRLWGPMSWADNADG